MKYVYPMRLYLILNLLLISLPRLCYSQNEDFATITIKAPATPTTVKVNGSVVDRLEPRGMLIISIAAGEKKMIMLEDSIGNKYLKEISAAAGDKGKNFFVQFPARPVKTEIVVAETKTADPIPVANKQPEKRPSLISGSKLVSPTGMKETSIKGRREIIASKTLAVNDALHRVLDGDITIDDTSMLRCFTELQTVLDTIHLSGASDANVQKTIDNYKAIKEGKRPGCKSLLTALKSGRTSDLPFWVNKKNILTFKIDDEPILLHALSNNYSPEVIRYLVETAQGNDKFINPFNYTFQKPYENYYLTPLAKACINGDTTVINLLMNANARFFPEGLDEDHAIDQAKFLWNQFGWNKDVRLLVMRRMPDFPNPEMDKAKAVTKIVGDMVRVAGGSFVMGCKGDRADCGNRYPQVNVTVKSFYISRYELTQQAYQSIMESNPSANAGCMECPVENLSWEEIEEFLKTINNLSNKKFRMPTEIEWEYAARGGSTNTQYTYSGSNVADSVAWDKMNTLKTQPVGKKKPNELGLYDMSGNVFEWCSSFYSDNLDVYKTSGEGMKVGSERVARGGCFSTSDYSCGVGIRNKYNIAYKSPQVGIRLVYDE